MPSIDLVVGIGAVVFAVVAFVAFCIAFPAYTTNNAKERARAYLLSFASIFGFIGLLVVVALNTIEFSSNAGRFLGATMLAGGCLAVIALFLSVRKTRV